MSVVPKTIKVRVLAETGIGVPGVVVVATLMMPQKNSYSIGPHVTDTNGDTVFTLVEFEKEVALCRRVFPMDYSCQLEDATGLNIRVSSVAEISRIIEFANTWGSAVPEWQLTRQQISSLHASKNRLLKPMIKEVDFSLVSESLVVNVQSVSHQIAVDDIVEH